MNSRISLVLKTKNMSSAQLADELGVQRSGISHILNGRNKPSLDFILRLIKKYPDISVNWLLFGEGAMMNPYPLTGIADGSQKSSIQKSMLELFADTSMVKENNATPEASEDDISGAINTVNQGIDNDFDSDSFNGQKNLSSLKEEDIRPFGSSPGKNHQNSTANIKQDNKEELEIPKREQNQSKKIDRIIVFYHDRSFREYYPE